MALLTRSVSRPLERRSSQFRRLTAPSRIEQNVEMALTVLMLVAALPVMAVAWVLVRLTSAGPAIYTQRRSGLRGREFQLHKFRSMTWQCEAETGAVWAAHNDPRVTWFGALLRR